MKLGRFLSRLILILVLPICIVSVLAASFGFDSVFEMLKSLVEEVLPFGNVVAEIMGTYYNIEIGKDITVLLIITDIIKSLISSILFTLFASLIPILFPNTSEKKFQFFLVKTLLSVLVAVASGFVLEKIENKLSIDTYDIVPVLFLLVMLIVAAFFWFRYMIMHGFKLGMVRSYFWTGKVLPSLLRTSATYACISILIIVITDDTLSMAIMPSVLVIFGIIMAISSLFEDGFVTKSIGKLWK